MPFGQNAVISGNVTAARDLAFKEDKNSTVAIAVAYWNRCRYVTSLPFSGEVNVTGAIIADGQKFLRVFSPSPTAYMV